MTMQQFRATIARINFQGKFILQGYKCMITLRSKTILEYQGASGSGLTDPKEDLHIENKCHIIIIAFNIFLPDSQILAEGVKKCSCRAKLDSVPTQSSHNWPWVPAILQHAVPFWDPSASRYICAEFQVPAESKCGDFVAQTATAVSVNGLYICKGLHLLIPVLQNLADRPRSQ